MKLFLTSQWLLPQFCEPFQQLVGKPLAETAAALIENGADDEPGDPRWVQRARSSLVDVGMAITRVDLRKYIDPPRVRVLLNVLAAQDVIWVGGGNTFYLNWLLHESGAAQIIKHLVASGTVYGGGSAGAIVAGPTIHGFEATDDTSFAPKLLLDALHLTDSVILPHWGRQDYGAVMTDVARQMQTAGFRTIPLTDRQALIVNDHTERILSV